MGLWKKIKNKINNKNLSLDKSTLLNVGGDVSAPISIVNIYADAVDISKAQNSNHSDKQDESDSYSKKFFFNSNDTFLKEELKIFDNCNELFSKVCFNEKNVTVDDKDIITSFTYKLMKWIVGDESFPIQDIDSFSENIKDISDKKYFPNFITNRWEIIKLVFSNNVDGATEIIKIIDNEITKTNLSEFIKNDFYIDARNISAVIDNMGKKSDFDKYQNFLIDSQVNITYPEIDRLFYDSYSKVTNDIIKDDTSSIYTIELSSSMSYRLNELAKALFVAMLNGSYTQLVYFRTKLAQIIYLYFKKYREISMLEFSMRLFLLSGETKQFVNLYNANNEIIRKDFMLYFIDLVDNKNILYAGSRKDIFRTIFEVFGINMDDKTFRKYEKKIKTEMKETKNIHGYSNCLIANAYRFDSNYIFNNIIMFDKGKYIDFVWSRNLISKINVSNLTDVTIKKIIKFLKMKKKLPFNTIMPILIKLKENNYISDEEVKNVISSYTIDEQLIIRYNLNDDMVSDDIFNLMFNEIKNFKDLLSSNPTQIPLKSINYDLVYDVIFDKINKKENIDDICISYYNLIGEVLKLENFDISEKVSALKTITDIYALIKKEKIIIKEVNTVIEYIIANKISLCKKSRENFFANASNPETQFMQNIYLLSNVYFNLSLEELFNNLNSLPETEELLEIDKYNCLYKKIETNCFSDTDDNKLLVMLLINRLDSSKRDLTFFILKLFCQLFISKVEQDIIFNYLLKYSGFENDVYKAIILKSIMNNVNEYLDYKNILSLKEKLLQTSNKYILDKTIQFLNN